MSRTTGLLSVAAGLLLSASLCAAPVSVTNYNWLQLPPNDVVAFVGSSSGTGAIGYGQPADYRWGHHVWIPDWTRTNTGTGTFWAALNLGAPRNVTSVWTQWWAQESTGIQKFYVDSSSNGTTWSQVGSYDFGTMRGVSAGWEARFRAQVPIPAASYQYLRVRVEPGDYAWSTTNSGRGGPGIYAIEPVGSDTIDSSQVNWVNQGNFTTSVSNSAGIPFNFTRYNDGWLYDDEAQRTGGAQPWAAGTYMQINLGTPRLINQVIGVWDADWKGPNFKVQYSTDGTNFFYVGGQSALLATGSPGASWYKFNDVTAQWFRITEANGTGSWNLLNQVLLFVPEPTSAILLVLGGALALRRRRG